MEGDAERPLLKAVATYLPELHNIFNNIIRTAQLNDEKTALQGWYSLSQRNKKAASWITALTMLFIKQYCNFISYEITNKAKRFFKLKYRDGVVGWDQIYDSTAAKSKLRLMFEDEEEDSINPKKAKLKTAMLYGPPGTGKTTFARALAKKLNWQYLELTPGDFYAGGIDNILPRINEIFNNLQQLKETVVFIDEIDDLVTNREKEGYDPRTAYVNTLLPRFQDIHDHGNVILVAATNHLEKVDKAIGRHGRFDLVILIGGMSIHGRIDMFFKSFLLNLCTVTTDMEKLKDLLKIFLEKTQKFTYSDVKIIVSNLRNIFLDLDDMEAIKKELTKVCKTIRPELEEDSAPGSNDKKEVDTRPLPNTKGISQKENIKPRPSIDSDEFDIEQMVKVNKNVSDECIELYFYLMYLIEVQKKKAVQKKLNILKKILAEPLSREIAINKVNTLILSLSGLKSNDFYYSIITPFFDSIISVLKGYETKRKVDKPSKDYKKFKETYEKLKNKIKSRPVI